MHPILFGLGRGISFHGQSPQKVNTWLASPLATELYHGLITSSGIFSPPRIRDGPEWLHQLSWNKGLSHVDVSWAHGNYPYPLPSESDFQSFNTSTYTALDVPQENIDAILAEDSSFTPRPPATHGFVQLFASENGPSRSSNMTHSENSTPEVDKNRKLGFEPINISASDSGPLVRGTASGSHKYALNEKSSMLREQETRQSDVTKCSENGCHNRPFADKAGLHRHQREVHRLDIRGNPARTFVCPEKNCNRHKKGFGRQWNMEQHYRRRHPNKCVSLGAAPHSLSPTADDSKESDENPDMIAPVHASKRANSNVTQELHVELDQLRREKKKIEDDIDALERVIRRRAQ